MIAEPLVSILIPVYNRRNLVGAALNSALNQTYPNIEIVVSDNCSDDGTWGYLQEIAGSDNRIVLVRTPSNLGPVPNWGHCLKHSKGELIKFVFSDDWMRNDCVEKMVGLLYLSKCDVIVSSVTEVSGEKTTVGCDLTHLCKRGGVIGKLEVRGRLLDYSIPLSPGAALYRRSAVEIKSEFQQPDLMKLAAKGIGPDLLMFLRATNNGCMVETEFLSIFQRHSGSISEANSCDLHYSYNLFLQKFGELSFGQMLSARYRSIKWRVKIQIIKFLNRKK
jgi:glycosyltransferase involved in cell wall biosynthesis